MKNKLLRHDARRTYSIILEAGDEVIRCLAAFARLEGLSRAEFSGLGSLKEVLLGCFELNGEPTVSVPISEQVGVASLIGNILLSNGEPRVEPHAVLRTADGGAWGGRLLEGHAYPRLNILLSASGWAASG